MKLNENLSKLYYTAAEARKTLGVDEETFQYWGRSERIKRIYLPGRKQPVYSKQEINKIANRIEATMLAEQDEGVKFRKATFDDIEKEADLAHLVFGEKARAIEARKTFLEKNSSSSYHLYDQDMLVAYINVIPLKHQAIDDFMQAKLNAWKINPDDIEEYKPGKPVECLIIDMVSTPTVPPAKRTFYGSRLLAGLIEELSKAGRNGIEITKVYAASETPLGIRILTNAGFKVIGEARKGRLSFELDTLHSEEKILREYQAAIGEWKTSKNTQPKNRRRRITPPTTNQDDAML
jgi:hypothetical protein